MKTLKFIGVLVGILAFTACASTSSRITSEPPVQEKVLDNGLRVIVKPDHRAPIVVSQVWYKVGSSYEPNGLTGISHVLEHMMFKGTKQLGPNEFSRIIAANGGRENAFTGRDYTAYFQSLEKSRLEVSFKWEADRMQNLLLAEEEFKKEIEVVKEERRLRTEDKPEGLTYEKFMATAYSKSNYRNPIIGWPKDLGNMKLSDLQKWYEQYYAPNNATIVVAGDVEPNEVFALAEKYFGPIPPRKKLAPSQDPAEPIQTETRRVTVRAPAKVPYLLMGYHVPVIKAGSLQQWEPYALEILAYILDGGKSARLNAQLVRGQQVAADAGVSYDPTSRHNSLFLFDANPAQDRTVPEVEKALRELIAQLQTELVEDKELQRIKTQLLASRVYERDSVFYQAMKLGELVTIGLPWQLDSDLVTRLQAVTPQQVRAVARKYLVDSNLTVAVMEPKPVDMPAAVKDRGH